MDNVERIIRSYQAAGLYTHVYVACGFLNDNNIVFESTLSPDQRHVFDLASLTKALVTTPLVLAECFEQGLSPESATLETLFGKLATREFAPYIARLSVASVLRHESGLPAWRNFYVKCLEQRQNLSEVVERAGTKPTPSREVYSDIGFILLGRLLELKKARSLIDLWTSFLQRLDGVDDRLLSSGDRISGASAVPSGFCPVRDHILEGEVHDENAWALGGFAGHAGLFGDGRAVASYLQALWRSSVGNRVLESNFQMISSPGESLMGWRKGRDQSACTFADGRGCGHLGFTGTAFWVDPQTLGFGIMLTNRVISGRISSEIKDARSKTFAALWDILLKKSRP